MDYCCTGDIDSVWHKHWTETIYVGQWPIFHGPVILPYILKTINGIIYTVIIVYTQQICNISAYNIHVCETIVDQDQQRL